MKYYRVKQEADQTPLFVQKGYYLRNTGRIWIGRELITEKELQRTEARYTWNGKRRREAIFETVEVPKNAVYMFFGARYDSREE